MAEPCEFDISVHNSYLPFSSENIHDSPQYEDDGRENQQIETVIGNRNEYIHIETQQHSLSDDVHTDNNIPNGWTGRTSEYGWRSTLDIPQGWKLKNNSITIRKENKLLLAAKLPTIFLTNHRSFFPKFNNFVDLMKTLDLTLGLRSEVWQVKENKSHQDKIEEALEPEGIQYISNPRPERKGGGVAISLLPGEFTLTKLDVLVPKNIEVVWGIVRPVKPTVEFKGIIVCSFYCAPNSKTKTQLTEHIAINHGQLKAIYKNCFFLAGGDKNELNIKHILDISATLHMHNTKTYPWQKKHRCSRL